MSVLICISNKQTATGISDSLTVQPRTCFAFEAKNKQVKEGTQLTPSFVVEGKHISGYCSEPIKATVSYRMVSLDCLTRFNK